MEAQRNVSLLSLAGVYATTQAIAALTGVPEPLVNQLARELKAKQGDPPKGLIHLKLFNKHLKRYAKARWYQHRGEEGPPCPGGVLPVEGL